MTLFKDKTVLRIILGIGLFLIALLYIENIRKQPRPFDPSSIWPDFVIKDIDGRDIRSHDYHQRIRYVQFVNIADDNTMDLLKCIYSQWADHVDIFMIIKNERLLVDIRAGFPKAIIIQDPINELAEKFRAGKYGNHYIFNTSGIRVFSAENHVRYEYGVKRIFNLLVNDKHFNIKDHIRENDYLHRLTDFRQIDGIFNHKETNGYLLVGLVYSFCESCVSGTVVNALGKIHSLAGRNGSALLLLSNEYCETDIGILKSQLGIDYPVLIADEALNRRWKEWIDEYSIAEVNTLVFLVDPSGRIDKVLDLECSPCARTFWQDIQKLFSQG